MLAIFYTILIGVITFIFKEKSQKILVVAVPVFLLLAIIVVLSLIIIDYFQKRFAELEDVGKRVTKLEEAQAIDIQLRKIEGKLIRQEHQEERMEKQNSSFSLHKKGNANVLYIILALLLVALLLWLIFVLKAN